MGRDYVGEDLSFIQCMECSRRMDDVNQTNDFVYLICSTGDEMITQCIQGNPVRKKYDDWRKVWGAAFYHLQGTMHFVRASYSITPSWFVLQRSEPSFYIHWFFKEQCHDL